MMLEPGEVVRVAWVEFEVAEVAAVVGRRER
jgi:hypothetical protein